MAHTAFSKTIDILKILNQKLLSQFWVKLKIIRRFLIVTAVTAEKQLSKCRQTLKIAILYYIIYGRGTKRNTDHTNNSRLAEFSVYEIGRDSYVNWYWTNKARACTVHVSADDQKIDYFTASY